MKQRLAASKNFLDTLVKWNSRTPTAMEEIILLLISRGVKHLFCIMAKLKV